MASLDDYDEFGNYIGADLDSDDEDDIPQNTFVPESAAPLEGYDDDDPMQGTEEGALIQIDGSCFPSDSFSYPVKQYLFL